MRPTVAHSHIHRERRAEDNVEEALLSQAQFGHDRVSLREKEYRALPPYSQSSACPSQNCCGPIVGLHTLPEGRGFTQLALLHFQHKLPS